MWYWKDQDFTSQQIGEYVGYVYLITEIETGMKYVGQKVFWNKVAKPPLKGKTKRRLSKKESNYMEYYGSGPQIKALVALKGPAAFRREILYLCQSKSEMNYLEAREIFVRDALLRPDYANDWISTRINRNTLGKVTCLTL